MARVNSPRDSHDLDAIDEDIKKLGQGYAALAKGQEAIVASFVDLRDNVLTPLREAVEGLAARVNAPQSTNWSAILAGLAVAGALAVAYIVPIRDDGLRTQGSVTALSGVIGEVRRDAARGDAADEETRRVHTRVERNIEQLRDKVEMLAEQLSSQEAKIDANAARIREVDITGSRKLLERTIPRE